MYTFMSRCIYTTYVLVKACSSTSTSTTGTDRSIIVCVCVYCNVYDWIHESHVCTTTTSRDAHQVAFWDSESPVHVGNLQIRANRHN